jgi:hypothetical protein
LIQIEGRDYDDSGEAVPALYTPAAYGRHRDAHGHYPLDRDHRPRCEGAKVVTAR